MKIEVYTGNYKYLASGTLLTINNNIRILLEDLICEVMFITDASKSTGHVQGEIDPNNKSKLNLTLFNFDSLFGQNTAQPLDLATIDNKKLFLDFQTQKLSENRRSFTYTFYFGEE